MNTPRAGLTFRSVDLLNMADFGLVAQFFEDREDLGRQFLVSTCPIMVSQYFVDSFSGLSPLKQVVRCALHGITSV
jgi:hypothetical protein